MEKVQDLLIDQCLQYPIRCAAVFTIGLYYIAPYYFDNGTTGKLWVLRCLGAFGITALVLTWLIPQLQLTADRIIFRPTPSCSTFNNPTRYLAFILNEHNHQVFYVTTEQRVVATDPHMKEATSFYIISSWIRSPDHYRITSDKILFQPASTDEVKSSPYVLRRGYCVRAAGPTTTDLVHIAFYSYDGHKTILKDTGYINKKDLEEFHSGWFLVSNCKTDVGRWLFDCKTGYVSSAYVRFTEYTRAFLREETTVAEEVKTSHYSPSESEHTTTESGNDREVVNEPSEPEPTTTESGNDGEVVNKPSVSEPTTESGNDREVVNEPSPVTQSKDKNKSDEESVGEKRDEL